VASLTGKKQVFDFLQGLVGAQAERLVEQNDAADIATAILPTHE
jgi:hypothetical protein